MDGEFKLNLVSELVHYRNKHSAFKDNTMVQQRSVLDRNTQTKQAIVVQYKSNPSSS